MTKSEFAERLKNNNLHIALIGMSNTGKSFRSNEMENEMNFEAVHVDEKIEQELNLSCMKAMAEWMGYPSEEKYIRRSQRYLQLEEKHTVVNDIATKGNLVLDTTGSVIYLNEETHQHLHKNFLIILLDISEDRLEEMKKMFFEEPKSVYWGDSFSQKKEEPEIDAIKRCYPKLLSDRIKEYRNHADIIIPGEISKYVGLSLERFLEIISFALPE